MSGYLTVTKEQWPFAERFARHFPKGQQELNNQTFQNKVPIDSLARQVKTSDFIHFTHILAADESNLRNLNGIKPSNATADVRLWGSYLDNKPIPDPYYGGMVSAQRTFSEMKIKNHLVHRVVLIKFTTNACDCPMHSSMRWQRPKTLESVLIESRVC